MMITSLDMNTPDSKLDDDGGSQISFANRLESQLKKDHFHRIQPRDYGRILRETNAPATWYRVPRPQCSIYFYDPQYQRYLQERSEEFKPLTPMQIKVD